MTHSKPCAALQGYRVLDLTSVVMGPYATQQLGDVGADVIWLEPVTGGSVRGMGPGNHPQFSGIALNLLRNKRSLAVDMKHPAGREAVLRVAATCDVVITNLRPKPLARLRLAYEDVVAVRPDIIFCQAQGFRSDGPRADEPAYDDIIQAECGVADATRRTGRDPMIAPTIMADKICGMAIAQSVMAALLHRERTGDGQRIEVPMLDVMRAFMLVEHGAEAIASPRSGTAGYGRVLNSERGPQRTQDGWINILPYSAAAYEALFKAGGREDLLGDPRAQGRQMALNAEFLYAQIRPIIAQRTTDHWLRFCQQHQIPVGSVATLDEIAAAMPIATHPEAGDYRLVPPPVWFARTPAGVHAPAPGVGQDTRAVLGETGYSAEEIEDLVEAGVLRVNA
jgi:crotonobetainyl-CoA:carnitine CoA-transferase CaiB-like acyl-CoA transferase